MTALVGDVITKAQRAIGEAAGPGVQIYSEDRMLDEVARGFNLIFKKVYWPQYTEWFRCELDGVLGVIDDDQLGVVKDHEDFLSVNYDHSDRRIPALPTGRNPYTIAQSSSPQYWSALHVRHASYATKKLRFYPNNAEGFVNIGARIYPVLPGGVWTPEDTMNLDEDMLVYSTSFMALIGDDTNPGAAELMQKMMEMRYRDIMASLADQPIVPFAGSHVPDYWSVA